MTPKEKAIEQKLKQAKRSLEYYTDPIYRLSKNRNVDVAYEQINQALDLLQSKQPCKTCGGSGEINDTVHSVNAGMNIFKDCPDCKQPEVDYDKCPYCGACRVVRPTGQWQYYCKCDDPAERPKQPEAGKTGSNKWYFHTFRIFDSPDKDFPDKTIVDGTFDTAVAGLFIAALDKKDGKLKQQAEEIRRLKEELIKTKKELRAWERMTADACCNSSTVTEPTP